MSDNNTINQLIENLEKENLDLKEKNKSLEERNKRLEDGIKTSKEENLILNEKIDISIQTFIQRINKLEEELKETKSQFDSLFK